MSRRSARRRRLAHGSQPGHMTTLGCSPSQAVPTVRLPPQTKARAVPGGHRARRAWIYLRKQEDPMSMLAHAAPAVTPETDGAALHAALLAEATVLLSAAIST